LITALLLLFGVTTFTLVSAGGQAYRRIMDKREAGISLRVALSYMTTQLRQNDIEGAVLLRERPGGGPCLVLRRQYDEEFYDTRIYLEDGLLREFFTSADAAFDRMYGDEITPLTGLDCRFADPDNKLLILTVTAGQGEHEQTRQTVVALTAGRTLREGAAI